MWGIMRCQHCMPGISSGRTACAHCRRFRQWRCARFARENFLPEACEPGGLGLDTFDGILAFEARTGLSLLQPNPA